MITWIVCANQGGAKIWECIRLNEELKFVADLAHPVSRLKEGDINTDRPGAKFGGGPGHHHHGTGPTTSAKVTLAEEFSRFLNVELERAIDGGLVDKLVICADPKFLGQLRAVLSKRVEARVIGSLHQNVYELRNFPLLDEVRPFIQTALRAA